MVRTHSRYGCETQADYAEQKWHDAGCARTQADVHTTCRLCVGQQEARTKTNAGHTLMQAECSMQIIQMPAEYAMQMQMRVKERNRSAHLVLAKCDTGTTVR